MDLQSVHGVLLEIVKYVNMIKCKNVIQGLRGQGPYTSFSSGVWVDGKEYLSLGEIVYNEIQAIDNLFMIFFFF